MKVAFATTDGIHVNEHFGRAAMFEIYEVTPGGNQKLETRIFSDGERDETVEQTRGQGAAHDRAVDDKVQRLADCPVIYITSIGGPSAARLSRRGVMPVKVQDGAVIAEQVKKLTNTINGTPPPWLKKLV